MAADKAFPTRKGWFLEYFTDLQKWSEVPGYFKPWAEYELASKTLRAWSPGTIHGLFQTERYARALIGLERGVSPETIDQRTANRMIRQATVLEREPPPEVHYLVNLATLRDMPRNLKLAQLLHLLDLTEFPNVTLQVVPRCWHAGISGGFLLADNAAWSEGSQSGQVYGGEDAVSAFSGRFDSIRHEALRVSDSLALIREMIERERLAKVVVLKRDRRRLRGSGLR